MIKSSVLSQSEREGMEVVLGIICGYYGTDDDDKRYEIVKEQLSPEELNQLDEICTYVLADEQGHKTVSDRVLKKDIPLLRKVYNIIDDNDLFKNSQGDYDWDAMSGFEKICLTSSRKAIKSSVSKTQEVFNKAILKAAELVKQANEESEDEESAEKRNSELSDITSELIDLPFDFELEPQELEAYIKKIVPADYFDDNRCWSYLYDVVFDDIYRNIGFNTKYVNSNRRTNMKVQSKRAIKSGTFIKSGAGAGYDVTIEGIELDTQNYKVISDEINNEEYNEHIAIVEVPVKPCSVEWEAEDYYNRVSSKDGIELDGIQVLEYFDDDKRVDGGKASLNIFWTEHEEGRYIDNNEFENVNEAVEFFLPSSIDIKSSFSAGWIHSDLPTEQIHFEDKYHHNEIDLYNDGYGYTITSVDLVAPNISENINWFFAHDYELEKIFFDDEEYDEIDSSRKTVTSGLSFNQAVKDFKSASHWSDYWEMQQDWEAYKDGLERDGVISEKTRSTWGNPCTPEGFKKWNK